MPRRRRRQHVSLTLRVTLTHGIRVRRIRRLINVRRLTYPQHNRMLLSVIMPLLLTRPMSGQRQRTRLKANNPLVKRQLINDITRCLFITILISTMTIKGILNRLRSFTIRRKRTRLRQIHRTRLINLRRGITQGPRIRIRMLLLSRLKLALRTHVSKDNGLRNTVTNIMLKLRRIISLTLQPCRDLSRRQLLKSLNALSRRIVSLRMQRVRHRIARHTASKRQRRLFMLTS